MPPWDNRGFLLWNTWAGYFGILKHLSSRIEVMRDTSNSRWQE
jgi:hypothetical protein